MARYPQSNKKTVRVAQVLSDHGTSLGKLLKHASFLMQIQHLLAGSLDSALAAHFQVATIRKNKLILIAPSATWATALRMQSPQLIQSLHQAGYPDIRSIDVRVAPLVEQSPKARKKRPLSPAARQALDSLSHIKAGEKD